jgi:hypothetical protein
LPTHTDQYFFHDNFSLAKLFQENVSFSMPLQQNKGETNETSFNSLKAHRLVTD